MLYLKCISCGHMNQVKSEYLTFCTACDKKLENNYQDWSRRNSDQSFHDFKQNVCFTEEEVKKLELADKKKRPKGLKYWIGLTIMIAIGSIGGRFASEEVMAFIRSEKTAVEILDQEWDKRAYGDLGLFLESPLELTKVDLPIPENVKGFIDKINSFYSETSKGFKIHANSIQYNPSAIEGNLEGAADGAVNEMKMLQGVSNFDYTQENTELNDIPGIMQKGSFVINKIEYQFVNVTYLKGLRLWQVLLGYQTDDEVGRQAVQRVLNSVEIKN